jgi:hypothetical protein
MIKLRKILRFVALTTQISAASELAQAEQQMASQPTCGLNIEQVRKVFNFPESLEEYTLNKWVRGLKRADVRINPNFESKRLTKAINDTDISDLERVDSIFSVTWEIGTTFYGLSRCKDILVLRHSLMCAGKCRRGVFCCSAKLDGRFDKFRDDARAVMFLGDILPKSILIPQVAEYLLSHKQYLAEVEISKIRLFRYDCA